MNLLDSLLDAIVRLDGDALVMHVGEKPYVVTTSSSLSEHRGPLAWGQVELSSRILTPDAVLGMLGQILPLEQRQALEEMGAIEHEIPAPAGSDERFTVVAARGGDDVWLEVRRRTKEEPAVIAVAGAPSFFVDSEPPAEVLDTSRVDEAVAVAAAQVVVAPPEQSAAAAGHAESVVAEIVEVRAEDEESAGRAEEVFAIPLDDSAPAVGEADAQAAGPMGPYSQVILTDEEVDALVAAMESTETIEAHEIEVDADDVEDAAEGEEVLDLSSLATPATVVSIEVRTFAEEAAVVPARAAGERGVEIDVVVGESAPVVGAAGVEEASEPGVVAEAEPVAHTPLVAVAESIERFPVTAESMATSRAVEVESKIEPASLEPEIVRPVVGFGSHATRAAEPVVEPAPHLAETRVEPVFAASEAPPRIEVVAAQDEPAVVGVADESPGGEMPGLTIAVVDERPADMGAEISKEAEPVPVAHETAAHGPVEEVRPAMVVPISRSTVRPEPVQASPAALAPVEHILRIAAARGASTVYVVAQSKPMIRVDGEISALEGEPTFTTADVERLVMDLAPARGRDVQAGPVEWMTDVPDVGRVRCVTFCDHRGPGMIFRMIPPRAISADQLGLPAEVLALCAQPDGLVLVTGARASGKSTLLSAFVDLINRTRSDHVISVESQINFVHESRKSFVSQREVRGDADAAAAAVRSAFREDPDVLVIEDLRTAEIVSVALEAAESGRLVLGSLSAPSTVAAIERLVELFSPERRAHVQTSLAGALRGIVAQALLRKMKGGRIAAREVLLNTPAVSSLILEGRTFQLPVALDAGRRHGMVPLTDSLAALVREGTVHVAEAYRKALDREALLAVLKRDGIDTSFAERLA